MYPIVIFILLPLSLKKDLTKLRFFSIFAVSSLLLMMIIIVIQTPHYYNYWNEINTNKKDQLENKSLYNIWDFSTAFTSDFFYFKGTATIFYSFTCHVGALPIMKTLKNNYNRRIQKVIKRSVLMNVIIYLIIGICGYITCPINTPDLILERPKIGNTDHLMTIGRLFFLFTLIFKMPACYISLRISTLTILNIKEENMTPLMYFIIFFINFYYKFLLLIFIIFYAFSNKKFNF
jgi:hypothetical protein